MGVRPTAFLTLCLALVGCEDACPEELRPWVRVDLWRQPLAFADPALPSADTVRVELPLSALGEGGDVPQRLFAAPGVVRALHLAPARRLGFRLTIGSEPFFSFRPLFVGGTSCPSVYRVEARLPAGEWTVLAERRPEAGVWLAPEEETVDLGAFEGTEIELALVSADPGDEGPGCLPGEGATVWGSPAVHFREAQLPDPGSRDGDRGRPDVILLSFDAMRADALGAYGHEPSVTPALDTLAEESDIWLEAFSTFNGTNPSFASIMTGLYGKHHGIYDLRTPLPARHRTLAECLHDAGYTTGAVVSAAHLADRHSGLGQGFDTYDAPRRLRSAELATDLALNWIASTRRPFFLWLHLFDPHTPHTPPRPWSLGRTHDGVWGLGPVGAWRAFREAGPVDFRNPRLGGHESLYLGEVAYLDRQVDRLLGFLRSRGRLDDTLLVVLSDHGENLLEHGFPFRHDGLWDSTTRVPLMIRWPGAPRPGRRLEGFAQTLDVFPTILGTAGPEAPPSAGRDLAGWTRDSGRDRVFAEHMNGYGTMVRTDRYLYMRIVGQPGWSDGGYLYDLANDPAQELNVGAARPEVAAELDALVLEWLADRDPKRPASLALDDDVREQLEGLGYVDP